MKRKERLIINIESCSPSVEKNFHLDWFEASIWTSFAGVSEFIRKIKKALSCLELKESYGNQRYLNSLRSEEFGITLYYESRTNTLNAPLHLLLTGRFFRLAMHYDFMNWLLDYLNSRYIYQYPKKLGVRDEEIFFKWRPIRIDASVDFISFSEVYIPYPSFKRTTNRHEKEFSERWVGDRLETITYGLDGCRLTVYDKLRDRKDPEFLSRHPEYDSCRGVWRLEFQFRRSELKDVYKKVPDRFKDYSSVYNLVLGQCFRRFSFQGFDFPASEVSTYIKRAKPTDEGKLNMWLKRRRSAHDQVIRYERLVFPVGVPGYVRLLRDDQAAEHTEQCIIDFEKELNEVPF